MKTIKSKDSVAVWMAQFDAVIAAIVKPRPRVSLHTCPKCQTKHTGELWLCDGCKEKGQE